MYKYQVICGATVWSIKPTSFYKAKKLLERIRRENILHENEFEIERVQEFEFSKRRYWRKVLGKWVMYPQCLKRSEELTPYEHYSYHER